MTDFGLPTRTLNEIANCLKTYPQIENVQIFGSRAMGNYRENSDVDMCLWGDINNALMTRIWGALDDLPTPYKFDVIVYDSISHPPFREHIDDYGVDFWDAIDKKHNDVENR